MSSVQVYEESKAWPFVEAKRLLKHIERKGKKPGDVVTFESGYGPSGAPHIGTFAEVVRTLWVMKAFDDLTQNAYRTRLIMFSDDYDGFRKVPDGMPEWMNNHLGEPLSAVPNPYETEEDSFADANNVRLVEFVDNILATYDNSVVGASPNRSRVSFVSSTDYYRFGKFNELLDRVFDNNQAILDIILPTLGEDRKQTYSPFMPVFHKSIRSDKTPYVNQVPVTLSRTEHQRFLDFVLDTTPCAVDIHDGRTKLQWKVDWAMRWVYFDVDYEMSGKDLTDSVRLSGQICRVLGGTPPVNLTYELFLDKDGAKISKSKGNGFTIEEWLRYGTQESLAYYLYREPTRAKNLHAGVVPTAMDDYNNSLRLYPTQTESQKLGNPVYHVHNGDVISTFNEVTYSLLLNLIGSTGITDPNVVGKIVEQYCGNNSVEAFIPLAGNYFNDQLSSSISFRSPTADEHHLLTAMIDDFRSLDNPTAESIQSVVYEIGKSANFDKLQDWFKVIYEVVFGSEQGPRVGTFADMVGLERFINMVEERING